MCSSISHWERSLASEYSVTAWVCVVQNDISGMFLTHIEGKADRVYSFCFRGMCLHSGVQWQRGPGPRFEFRDICALIGILWAMHMDCPCSQIAFCSGKYAVCYQAKRIRDGMEVAVKVLSRYIAFLEVAPCSKHHATSSSEHGRICNSTAAKMMLHSHMENNKEQIIKLNSV